MNIEKRKQYNLTGSFHTLEIKSPDYNVAADPKIKRAATTRLNGDKTIATTKINANKYDGDIFDFEEFKDTFQKIITGSGISDYRITRADMRFDNYEPSHYLSFAKLNKYILSALAVTYKVKNVYKVSHLFSDNQLSIAIKNDYFEAENYDREQKNKVTDNAEEPAKARLEERTMARSWRKKNPALAYHDNDTNMLMLRDEFTAGWAARWDKARRNLEVVQDIYNDELVKKYMAGKNAYPVQFRSLTDFLIQNQNSIFSSMQMERLLARLGVPNPKNRARYHKQKYGIEYFSKQDVEFAIREIERATKEYFAY